MSRSKKSKERDLAKLRKALKRRSTEAVSPAPLLSSIREAGFSVEITPNPVPACMASDIAKIGLHFEGVPKPGNPLLAKLAELGYGVPIMVPYENHHKKPLNCWLNVPELVAEFGGESVSGRTVWAESRGRWLLLEAHCVWRKPTGELVDPTPKHDGEREVMFVPEEIVFEGIGIRSKYLGNDPELIAALERQHERLFNLHESMRRNGLP